ncbi:MAG TPA: serine/threonine-protein kinase, partial [Gemmatimonadales bacterium]|nr:serine/threonine-protein kinase [Gemmatimonadales bacterium]
MPGDSFDAFKAQLSHRYRVERELGRGGMATVYLAHDLKHERKVALKALRPEIALILGRERFQREIATVARLLHPHILPLHDSDEAAGLLFYVMPFVEGGTLADRLARGPSASLAEALDLIRQVASGLAYAHEQGLVHRDVKPANILLASGHAFIADFGVARFIREAITSDRLTESGLVLGTPAYMAPEQLRGASRVDGRADEYSLACVLYEMLTGSPPGHEAGAPGAVRA